jgi:FixJ family two-component response regulator
MAMLMTGQLNKQIGAAIGASESTVKAHRMHVMRKMEAASLVELIRMADRLGVGAEIEMH